jgi:Na+/melibiose symporter-like transporter
LAIKLGYSGGNLGKSIVSASFESFLLFYMVKFAGFAPLTAGGLLAAMMFWDAAADVGVAYLADRHGKAGALGRLILLGGPLCGISYWLIFAARLNGAIVVAAVVLCRVGYSLCDIGHNTLLIRVAPTLRGATTVSGLRLIFSSAGVGIVGLASAHILSLGDPSSQRIAFATCGMVGGTIYIVTLITSMWATRNVPTARSEKRPSSFKTMFGVLRRNPPYRKILVLIALQAGLVPMFIRALPFFGEIARGDAGWGGNALITITLAQAASLPVWIWLGRIRSAPQILTIAYAIMGFAIVVLAFFTKASLDGIPLAIMGMAHAGMNMAIWAMLTSAVQGGIAEGGSTEALPVGLFLATLKAASGIGNLLFASAVASRDWRCDACVDIDRTSFLLTVFGLPLFGCLAALVVNVTMPRYFREPCGIRRGTRLARYCGSKAPFRRSQNSYPDDLA